MLCFQKVTTKVELMQGHSSCHFILEEEKKKKENHAAPCYDSVAVAKETAQINIAMIGARVPARDVGSLTKLR